MRLKLSSLGTLLFDCSVSYLRTRPNSEQWFFLAIKRKCTSSNFLIRHLYDNASVMPHIFFKHFNSCCITRWELISHFWTNANFELATLHSRLFEIQKEPKNLSCNWCCNNHHWTPCCFQNFAFNADREEVWENPPFAPLALWPLTQKCWAVRYANNRSHCGGKTYFGIWKWRLALCTKK